MKRRHFVKIGGAALFSYMLLDAFVLELHSFKITRHKIGNGNKRFRLIQVSDLHLREFNDMHKRIVQEINLERPDCILFTGDMIDRNGNFHLIETFYRGLDRQSRKFGIMGNWEWWSFTKQEKLYELFSSNNGQFLINDSAAIEHEGKSIQITGLDDLIGGEPDEQSAFSGYQHSDLNIVAAHCPAHIQRINEVKKSHSVKVDMVFSGHTHGGQIQILGFAPVLPPGSGKYVSGLYNVDGTNMYVSRGIGTTRIPVRFGSSPEIGVFDFYL